MLSFEKITYLVEKNNADCTGEDIRVADTTSMLDGECCGKKSDQLFRSLSIKDKIFEDPYTIINIIMKSGPSRGTLQPCFSGDIGP